MTIAKINRFLIVVILSLSLVVTTSIVTAETDFNDRVRNYIQEGKKIYDRGEPNAAITIWQNAIEEYSKQGNLRQQAISYNYIAIAYLDLQEWDKSQKAIDNGLQVLNAVKDNFLEAQILNTKGILVAKTGKLEEAISTWKKAENIYQSLDAIEPLLRTKINQAQAYRTLGYGLRLQNILEEVNRDLAALPSVDREIEQITDITKSTVLIDNKFTLSNFKNRVETDDYSVIHIATHGQFSSNLQDTFLLAWDDKLNIQDISQLLQTKEGDRKSTELLVLSACETATGDNRATLGMAGIAVRSGARSTIGSLWRVSDRSTAQLMSNFYQLLGQNKTKSEALRQAQLSLINNPEYNHPYYWSPFTLIGNWQ